MKWRLPLLLVLLLSAAAWSDDHEDGEDGEEGAEGEHTDSTEDGNGQTTSSCGIGHCESCENPATICAMCLDGFVTDAMEDTCYECPKHCARDNCVVTDGKAKCKECKEGYYVVDGGNKCLKNSESCAKGKRKEEGENTDEVCEKATAGRILMTHATCEKCPGNCIACLGENTCTACKPGFAKVNKYLPGRALGAECKACSGGTHANGRAKCLRCDKADTCDECEAGTFLDSDTNTCLECIAHCGKCADDKTCSKCDGTFVLSPENTCSATTYCKDFTDGVGCTSCKVGYRVVDSQCEACPVVEEEKACKDASNSTLGRYMGEEKCEYCAKDCTTCEDEFTCTKCVKGMLWNAEACAACSEVIDSETVITKDMCHSCDDYYFENDVCSKCPEDDTFTTSESCTNCGSYFFSEGTCTEVKCEDADSKAACHACNKPFNAEASECGECKETAADTEHEEDCKACSTSEAPKTWVPDVCEDVLCVGVLDKTKCNFCSDTYWDTAATACHVVDCGEDVAMYANKPDMCNACPKMYHDGSTCVGYSEKCTEIKTAIEADTTEDFVAYSSEACRACVLEGVFYNTTSKECLPVEGLCDVPEDIDSQELCEACQRNDRSHGYKWDKDTELCEAGNECGWNLLADDEEVEWQCNFCDDMIWIDDLETCETYDCEFDDMIDEPEKCTKCEGKFYDEEDCNVVSCSAAADLDTPEKCHACRASHFYWNGEACQAYSSCDDDEVVKDTESKCDACSNKMWIPGHCKVPVCDPAPSDEVTCKACDKLMWDTSGDGECITLKCDDVKDENTCSKCDGYYWNGKKCVAMLDCEDDIISDTYRCDACNEEDKDKVWYWDAEEPSCVACPHENCNKCDEDKCTECAKGNVWDGEKKKCIDCVESAGTLDETQCGECAGFTFDAKDKCKKCIENCDSCSDTVSCDDCAPGFTLDAAKTACTDAVFEMPVECHTCGTSLRGNYYATTGHCLACEKNCATCDAERKCSLCAKDYYLDVDTSKCVSCTGAELNSEALCKACASGKQSWDSSSNKCATVCEDNQYKDGDDCKPCMSNCKKCDSATSCDDCKPGFFDTKGKTCKSNPANCVASENGVGCTKCAIGHYLLDLDDGTKGCTKCKTKHCDKCDSSGATCEMCNSNSCLDKEANECYTVASDSKCQTCEKVDDKVSCTSCHHSDYLEPTEACSDKNCDNCEDDRKVCKTCKSGYFSDSGQCTACKVKDCLECSDESTCSKCKPGQFSDDKACKMCEGNCLECKDAASCAKCPPMTVWSSTKCEDCPTDCATCSSKDVCTVCVPGTSKDKQNNCKKCGSDADQCQECEHTDTGFKCTLCESSYYLEGTKCAKCSDMWPGCKLCKNEEGKPKPKCIMCEEKQVVSDDDDKGCIACDIGNCDHCIDPEPICNECSTNYAKNEPLNTECHPVCYDCDTDPDDPDDPFCKIFNTSHPLMKQTACPGLLTGRMHCQTKIIKTIDKNVIVSRKCMNTTSGYEEEQCKERGEDDRVEKHCEHNCKGTACNKMVPAGVSANYPAMSAYLLGLLFACVTINRW